MSAAEPPPGNPLTCAVQYAAEGALPPSAQVKALARAAGKYAGVTGGEVTVRFISEAESTRLNATYRGKSGPTNVLSFDYRDERAAPRGRLFGDIAICAAQVCREADTYQLPRQERYAHLIVHGVLHLAGYDHNTAAAAAEMEAAEKNILAQFNLADPYR